jgi:hypothetical protein
MSVRSKIVTAAAALAIVAGVSAAGTQTANAATPSCGRECFNFFSAAFGTTAHPGFVFDVLNHNTQTGQPIILAPASGTNPGEDFTISAVDPVNDFVLAGLVSPGLDPLYGNLNAFEIEYTPYGAETGECVGLGANTGIIATVSLQACGVSAHTLWIYDPLTKSAGSFFTLISGTTSSNFRHPITMTALFPPGLPLTTTQLTTPPAARQLWGYTTGTLSG